eukprot:3955590-Alexandrium_andersonii.AAC.1
MAAEALPAAHPRGGCNPQQRQAMAKLDGRRAKKAAHPAGAASATCGRQARARLTSATIARATSSARS